MDIKTVNYLAELSKLEFSENELEKVASDMTGIIGLMDEIKEFDISYDPLKDNKNVHLNGMRKDEIHKSFDTQKILSNAVNSNNCFFVPKVVE